MSAVLESPNTPELQEHEIVRITRYHRPSKQLEFLKSLGIPAKLRADNTVCVLRMHVMHPLPTQQPANDGPKLKLKKK
jgi:hypothetical protein